MALAAQFKLPEQLYQFRDYVAAGGLIVATASASAMAIARSVSTPARSSKAPSPPICRSNNPARFEFVINMKTAKALGLSIPDKLLALADEVIE